MRNEWNVKLNWSYPVIILKHFKQTLCFSLFSLGMGTFCGRHFVQKANPQFLHPCCKWKENRITSNIAITVCFAGKSCSSSYKL